MKKKRDITIPILGIFIGGMAFYFLYGFKILNPSFIDWMMRDDAGQHFLGWHFFRSEPWTFPIGTIKSVYYPQGTSLVYMDAIPLMAIPLKVVSFFLPAIFQYHGIWVFMCYLLQGLFASILMKKITNSRVLIIICLPFFILFPIIMIRAGGQEALSAHFIILAALYLYFEPFNKKTKKRWLILLLVSLIIHFYLFTMAFAFFLAFLIQEVMKNRQKHFSEILTYLAMCLFLLVILMWGVGYFVINVNSAGSPEFGIFSMNLISPVNPAPYTFSTFLKALPLATTGQYEGFNYWGMGIFLLLLVAVYEFAKHKETLNKARYLPLLTTCFLLFLFSLSNKITMGDMVLFTIPLPQKIIHMLGVLRSSGRFFWPVSYVVIFLSIAVLIKYNSRGKAVFFLLIFLCIQTIDYLPFYRNINYASTTWNSPLKSEWWGKLAEKKKHIVFVPPVMKINEFIPFAFLAGTHNCTLNVAYTARGNSRPEYDKRLVDDFKSGRVDNDSLYIVKDQLLLLYNKKFQNDYLFGELDGYKILIPVADKFNLLSDFHAFSESLWVNSDDDRLTLEVLVKKYAAPGYVILISVSDEATAKLPGPFAQELLKLGSHIDMLKFRGSYGAIIVDGRLEKEQVNNNGEVTLTHRLGEYDIHLFSAGNQFGNRSVIRINNFSLSPNKRGFNIVVLNTADKSVKRYSFDTHQEDNPAENPI